MKLFFFLKVFLVTTLICFLSITFAQDGPGGIQDTTGTSSLVLWLDASKIEGINNYNTVRTWFDVSGYNHNVIQENTSARPNLLEDNLNGLSVVSFNGVSAHLQGTLLGGSFNAPNTIFVVPNYDDLNMPNNDNGYVLSIGTSSSSNQHFSIARRKSSGGNGNRYYSWVNDGSPKLGDTIVGESWNIITQINASSAPFHSMFLNGTASVVVDYSAAVQSDGVVRVGQWYNGGNNRLDGKIAEIIAFNKVLNLAEQNIVQSYLSAKYNLPIANDFYLGDDALNGDNDLTVVGIGVEADGSNTIAKSDGLQLEIESNFENGDYVVFGHNVEENTINNTDIDAGITSRWDRNWWLDITNSGANVNCNFQFSQTEGEIGFGGLQLSDKNDYKLIFKDSPSGSWSIIATANTVTFNKITFNNVNLVDDGYYTIGTIDDNSQVGVSPTSSSYKGPGGVGEIDASSNLKVWFNIGDMKAEDNEQLLSLEDFSGNENDAIQLGNLNISSFSENALNEKGAAEFNGANTYLSNTLNFNVSTPLTVFSVAYFNNINQANDDNDYVYSIGDGLSRGDQLSLSRRKANDEDDLANINKYYSWDGDTARYGDAIEGQTWKIFTQEFFSTGSPRLHNAYFNGTDANATDNETETQPNNNTFSVGRWNNNDHWLDGSLSELIIYNRDLNSAETNIVQSYLSGKYNIAVANDKYVGDNPANGDNDLNIAGVGTEADGSNATANSAGLILEQLSGFTTGDYIVMGHAVDTNSINEMDAVDDLGNNNARWDRAWYLDITNTSDNPRVNLSFDFSDVKAKGFPGSEANINYNLLYRSGTNGIWTNMNLTPTLNGDQVVFSNIELTDDGFYTLGTNDLSLSPLPVTLTNFAVKKMIGVVSIQWETLSEINNESFYLEKSEDAISYRNIYKTAGAGNSTVKNNYSFLDKEKNEGKVVYYRLIQTDFDGESDVFGPIAINFYRNNETIQVFPNPTKDFITVTGIYQPSIMNLHRLDGKKIYELETTTESTIKISVGNLEKGLYILTINNLYSSKIIKLAVQ